MRSDLDSYGSQKYLLKKLLAFMDSKEVAVLLLSLPETDLPGVLDVFHRKLGYKTDNPVCARMIKVMLDLLCECGLLSNYKGKYLWINPDMRSCLRTDFSGDEISSGVQIEFYDNCLSYADKFLSTGAPLYTFDNCSADVWENFLGNDEFRLARSVLANLLFKDIADDAVVLDLCCGPGFGVMQMQEKSAHIKIKALDFTDTFRTHVSKRTLHANSVDWISPDLWGGFGSPLPFEDSSLDRVFFACADPYIPNEIKEHVYRDIHRVLKSGGAMGILSRSYPDDKSVFVSDPWIRKEVLCHDFCESVCEGWKGFADAGKLSGLLSKVGFDIGSIMLNASVWRLDKS